jgi:hypothetical protein
MELSLLMTMRKVTQSKLMTTKLHIIYAPHIYYSIALNKWLPNRKRLSTSKNGLYLSCNILITYVYMSNGNNVTTKKYTIKVLKQFT